MLLFSPDGQRWSSVRTEEIFGYEDFPIDMKVGNDAVILRWLNPSEFQADTEEEPAEIDDDLPDIMWGRRVADPVTWPQIANSDTIRTSRPDNAVPKS